MADIQGTIMGTGCLFTDKMAPGLIPTGWTPWANVMTVTLTPQGELVLAKSKKTDTFNQNIGAVGVPDSYNFSFTSNEFNQQVTSQMLMGTVVAIDNPAGSAVDENQTVYALDTYIFLNFPHKNTNIVVKDVTDVTTYVLDTDYTVGQTSITDSGEYYIIPITGGAIAALDVLHISYDYGGESGYKVNAGTDSVITAAYKFVGQNQDNGTALKFIIPMGTIVSNGDLAIVGDGFVEGTLEGTTRIPPANHPYGTQVMEFKNLTVL